jgi:transcriptional regulator GlxA family with amidase domain
MLRPRLLHALRARSSVLIENADQTSSTALVPIDGARFSEVVIVGALLAHLHDGSAIANAQAPSAEPDHVRCVAEYLKANLSQPIRMAELASLSGVSVRSIQVGFQKHRGCSPLEFLRAQRLGRARTMLLGTDCSVTEVALACGFDHLGRFSVSYKARFEERPVETRSHGLRDRRAKLRR